MAERFRLIEISYNEVTKQKTVIHLAVTPIEVLYTVSTPVVTLGVTKQTAEVKSYLTTIQQQISLLFKQLKRLFTFIRNSPSTT